MRTAPTAMPVAEAVAQLADQVATIDRPPPGQTRLVEITAAKYVKFGFALSEAAVTMLDVDAVLSFPDGAKLVIPGMFLRLVDSQPMNITFNGVTTEPGTVVAAAGEVRLSEQLPFLAHSKTQGLEGQSGKGQDEAPKQQVVQVTANQSYTHTPGPRTRPFPTLGTGDGDSLQDTNGRFARKVNLDDVQASSLKGEGAITDRTDRNAIEKNQSLQPQNAKPVITSDGGGDSASRDQDENSRLVTTVTAEDGNASDKLTFAIAEGRDSSLFTINSQTGEVFFIGAPDFETPRAADGSNRYELTVQVSDGKDTDQQNLVVTVQNVNEAPTGATITASQVVENAANGTLVGQVIGSDPDAGAVLTYSFATGGDAGGRFAIDANTGNVTVLRGDLIDFEAGTGHRITVDITDQNGLTIQRSFDLDVVDAVDAPVITSDGGGPTAAISVNENIQLVTQVTATSPLAGTTLSYAITGGRDAALFTINSADGKLYFLGSPDFETPGSSVGSNAYELTVQVSDGSQIDTQSLVVTVQNVNEAPTGATITANQVVENAANGTLVGRIVGSDPDAGAVLTYSFVPGRDGGGRFAIDANTGNVTVLRGDLIDFEAGTSHRITVDITDQNGLFIRRNFDIAVTDAVDAPVITSDGGGPTAAVSLNENAQLVTQVTATSPLAGTTLSYAITGGRDAALFTINSADGKLYFVGSPDFETPGSGAASNAYELTVQASDGSQVDTQSLVVTVQNVNEAPTAATITTSQIVENTANGTLVGQVVGSDPDAGAVLTYSFAPGGDAGGRFAIDANTGNVTVLRGDLIDFEASSRQLITVRITDQFGLSSDHSIVLDVTNANDAPVITSDGAGSTANISIPETQIVVTTVRATDQDAGHVPTFSIAGGDDAIHFAIDANTGALRFINPMQFVLPQDADLNNIYEVIVQASDGFGGFDQQLISVELTYGSNAPTNIVLTSNTILENSAPGTVVGTAIASDPDPGAVITYTFIPGGDAGGRFVIDPVTGVISVAPGASLDYEDDRNHVVIVRATDETGLSLDRGFIINLTDVNEAPVITSNGGGATVALSQSENQAIVTTVTADDPEAAPLTYAISGGADAARFTINATTGVLSFVTPPDFENPTDFDLDNVYDVTVSVSDGTMTDSQAISVTITDTGEPPVITSNGGGATAAISLAENGIAVTTVTATDTDAGAVLTYSIVGGTDSARFTINTTTGALTFIAAPNFEAPTDAGANNVYDVIVRVSDGTFNDDQALAVTVTDLNDVAPVITSNGGGASAAISLAENNTAVTTVMSVDPDTVGTRTYSIIGGADQARFTINATTGLLSFVSAPDFENPTDADANNIYDVIVRVSDGIFTDDQSIAVTVTNVNESAPIITSNGGGATAAISVAENSTAVTTVTAIDPDFGAVLTYSIVGGADQARFTINATTGVLTFVAAPNFEAPTDVGANNVYDVVVRVSDGTNTDDQSIAVTVTNVNEFAPVITSNGGGATAAISRAENGTSVTTVTATDADAGATLSYSIVGGVDAGRFTINATTGVLTFVAAPNFEAPTDTGANNVYDVIVRVSDGTFTDDQTIAVTVTNVNEFAPVITSDGGGATAAISVAENSTAVTTVTATDADAGATLTYAIIGGADQARFTINATTGVLSFVAAPNFEAPTDSGANNVYDVVVRVSDGTNTDSQTIAVTVTNVNEFAPVITSDGGGATAAISVAENNTAVTTVTATDADAGATLTYSIVGGADQARFTINATTGVLSFVAAPDFEAPVDAGANNVYDVVVRVSDGTFTDDQTIAVTVTDSNDSTPVITSNGGGATAAISVAENGTAVTTVTAIDPDSSGTLTYSIIGGADQTRFTINATTGVLTFVAAPNFEAPTDVGANNVYDVIVRVSDGVNTDDQTIAVTVTDTNDVVPVITSNGGGATAAISITENNTAVTTVVASDPDTVGTLTYAIVGGADQARFTINATTGVLTFVAAPDFEAPTDVGANNVYDVVVRVSDGTFTDDQTIAVTVTNSNDNAPVITSDGGGATAAISVAENSTAVTTVTATDADAGATLTYSIVGGADQARFAINASTGVLTFVAAPNFEAPTDVGADNVYDVVVRVSDGANTDDQSLAVTVTNVNEFLPVITSNGGGATAAISVAENGTAVTTVTATDADAGATLTYSIVGGADQALFTINATTGVLTFVAAPDFEAPTDVGANNVYDVVVRVSDGTFNDTQTLAVTVTNVNESAPIITSDGGGATAAISVAENSTAVTIVTATDADAGATLTYSIVGGADQARFTINATTGVLTFVAAPNFEAPTDVGADNVYDVVVRVSDGAFTDDQSIAVTVTNVNEFAPAITSNGGGVTAAISVAENGTAVTTVTATDADAGATLTYAIVGGADQALFTINATTGVLTFVAPPDFEAPTDAGANNVYDVVVRVSDGTFTDDQTIAVTVTNVNDNAPVITSNGGGASAAISVAENSTAVTTVTATDADPGATLTYSIVGGADQARFAINASTGVLTFVAAPNFEAPTDVGADNVYDVVVRVSDGTNTDDQSLAVTVTNVNEFTPVITSNGGGGLAAISVAENGTAVTTVTATDADAGATLTYSIVGIGDHALFTINATTGVLTFVAPPDFEAPTDTGTDNVYDVTVRVSDGTFTDIQTISVTVTDLNDVTPVITSNGGGATAAISLSENNTGVTTVTATDPDTVGTLTYSIVGGADQARFTINATTGVLTFVSAPDFEAPTDAGANNVYDVVVRVSDGTNTDDQAIAVTVTDLNDVAPVITSNGGGATAAISVVENGTAVTTVTATDPDTVGSLVYTIIGGADQARFSINSSTGVLTFVTPPNFEAPTDAGADNVYDVVVRVSDGTNSDNQTIAVTVTDQNEAPVITSNGGGPTAAFSFLENYLLPTQVTATDPDSGATLTYSIIGGADQARFTMFPDGRVYFVTAPDFENPNDADGNNTYELIVQVSDGTLTDTQTITITVLNENEAPVITSNGGGATAAISVAENGTAVTTVTATDPDAGATQTYTIVGGADQARFTINASTGVLSFVAAPNFEAPTDVGADNVYDVVVRVSDGTLTDDQAIAVTVTNVNEFAPVITSDGGGATAAISMAENNTAVTTVTATDADAGATLTYSIVGGADQARFTINASTGVLSFVAAPDFEAPVDVGANNVYDVVVRVSDGTFTDDQTIAVTVTNVNDNAPVITSNGGGVGASVSIAENTNAVTTVTATDADAGTSLTYSIVGGVDAGEFTINASTGVLSFLSAPDHESPTDTGGNNVYDVIVRVSDGTLTDDQAIAVTVTDAVLGFSGTAANELFDFTLANDQVNGSSGTGNDTIIGGALSDTLAGAGGNDSISGGSGADMLFGEDGDDTLIGGAGNDMIDGGNGFDYTEYLTAIGSVTLDVTSGLVSGGGGNDTLVGIQGFTLSNHSDTITGVMAGQYVNAADGDDSVTFTSGAATMYGGNGNDILIYAGASSLSINLASQTMSGGNVISGFDHVSFGSGDDTIVGDTNNNQLLGGAGNDSISGGDGGDFVSGQDGDDTLIGGAGNDMIDGGNGTDTVDYSSSASGVSYNVGTGAVTGDGNDTLTSIERFIGSGLSDNVTGAQTGGYYDLSGGNDHVVFNPGNATVHGGTGNDYFYYNSLGSVAIDMAAGTISGGGVLSGFETVSGGFGNDTITGSTLGDVIEGYDGNDLISGGGGNDTLYGNDGNDTLIGGAGDDSIIGGNQTDTVDYSATAGAINLSITLGQGTSVDGNDTLTSIERFITGGFNDTIIGATNGHYVDAGGGNDFVFLNAGTATVVGGLGNDTLQYNDAGPVMLDIASGTTSSGGSFSGFESYLGTIGNDTIYGSGNAETIAGGSGNDTMFGYAGADSLIGDDGDDFISGGAGNDTLDGGTGAADTAAFSGQRHEYDIAFLGGTTYQITDLRTGSPDGIDTISNFENLNFVGWGLSIATAVPQTLTAGADNYTGNVWPDVIYGLGGNDTITGGNENDRIDGGAGNDNLNGGNGFDIVDYRSATSGVTVEVANPGVYVTGGSGTDTLANFEGVWGSNFNDTLYNYSATSVEIRGFDGDDYLISGGNGNSTIEGGSGNDTIDSYNGGDTIRGGDGNDLIYKDANSMSVAGNLFSGDAGNDMLQFYGPGNVNLADIVGKVTTIETIDLETDLSVAGNFNNFRGTDATSIMGVTGPGNTLTLMLDGNDNFTVAAGEHYSQAGSLYTFFSDAGLTNEIARVSVV